MIIQRLISMLSVCTLPLWGTAQTLYSNGATLQVQNGATLFVAGNTTVASGIVSNSGTLKVTGNVTNNAIITAPSASTLRLDGTTAQTLSGSQPINATNVAVNNAAGIILTTPLQADGSVTFTSGIVIASSNSAPFILTANGSVNGTATDASHVNGFVKWLGTGAFTYPVGSATKYQPVAVNLIANGSGLTAQYVSGNAGSAAFTSSGTDATPLTNYNSAEYWNLTPVSTASGTVTISWDGTNDGFPYALSQRRVAHKTGSAWQNEGGTNATGTTSTGSVTSNNISAWSPFTLGSVGFALPLHWLRFSGSLTSQKQALLNWQAEESSVASYVIEKSTDGNNFMTIGSVMSKGDGTNSYQFTDASALNGTAYYRIKQVDRNGKFSYSSIIKLSTDIDGSIKLYPNPVKDKVVVSIPSSLLNTAASLLNADGKQLQTIKPSSSVFTLDMSGYHAGLYLLRFADGKTEKIMKE